MYYNDYSSSCSTLPKKDFSKIKDRWRSLNSFIHPRKIYFERQACIFSADNQKGLKYQDK